ncbi:MAG: hypothetical protein ACM3NV_03945 [Syntrophothermus sp.]
MLRKLAPFIVALAALGPGPAGAAAYLPEGFIGVAPQGPTSSGDYELMHEAGVRSVRMGLSWSSVEPEDPLFFPPSWAGVGHVGGAAALARISVMPVVLESPAWVAGDPKVMPVRTAWQRGAWTRFLREAAARYGPEGEFWEQHPRLPYLPLERWEIWNEQNIVTFARPPDPVGYAKLLRISGRALHSADPGAEVILGGLFGRPLQVPPNVASGDFLQRVYRAGRVKPYFDGVALHPYVADVRAIGEQIRNLRRIMRLHGDARTPLYLTELGWGSRAGPTRWERGLYGQANELSRAFAMLSANRLRWRIGGAWWFSWADAPEGCGFCRSAGLLTEDREAKPSWYRFNAWTGGNPDIVPRIGAG